MDITNTKYFGWLVFKTSCYVNFMTILPQPQMLGLKAYTLTLGSEFNLLLLYFCLDS